MVQHDSFKSLSLKGDITGLSLSGSDSKETYMAALLLVVFLFGLLSAGCYSTAESTTARKDSQSQISRATEETKTATSSSSRSNAWRSNFTLAQVIAKSQAGLIVTVTRIEYEPEAPRSSSPLAHEHDIVTARIEKVLFGNFRVGDQIQILQPRYLEVACPSGQTCRSFDSKRPELVYEKGEGPVAMFLHNHEPSSEKQKYRFYAEKALVRLNNIEYVGRRPREPHSMNEVLKMVERRKAALKQSLE